MQIRIYFTLLLMLFSTTSFGAGAVQTFATKSECLRHFTLSSGTSNVVAGEAYCKDKVVKSAIDICADKKLLEFKMKNSISSVQEAQYFQKFKSECVSASTASSSSQQASQSTQTTQRDAQVAQQKAEMESQQKTAAAAQATAAAATAAAAAAKQNETTSAQRAAASANALQTLAPVIDKAASDVDAANAAAKKTAAAAEAAAPAAAGGAVVPTITGPAPTNTSADDGQVYLDKAGNTYQRQTVDGEPVITKIDSANNSTDEINQIPSDAVRVDGGAPPAGIDGPSVTGPMPEMAATVANAEKAAQVPSNIDAGAGPITSASEAKTSEVKSEVTTSIEQVKPNLTMHVPASIQAFPATVSGLEAFKAKYETFASSLKPTCAKLAETSAFLCVESPGAQAAKTMMDVAGPILAAVGTIQKACSNTANVTGMASKLLTIAKATCVTAKLACDGGCAAASASVKALSAQLKALDGTIASDQAKGVAMCKAEAASHCAAATVGYAACFSATFGGCQSNVNMSAQKAKATVAKLTATINKESVPAPAGSVAATQAKCTMNAKDIAGLAINAISLMKAKNDAAECDRKLASSGAAGGAVTPTKYCETPANAGTQFCKCQQNQNQEGCPGFAGKGSLIDKEASKDSVAGIDLKTGKGLSSFAGGSRGAATGFGPNGKQEFNPSAPGTGEKLALTGGDAAGAGSGGAYGGSAGGGGSSAGGGAGEGTGAGGKPEDKKWSFGSFANALGGMFGGGSGGKGASSKGNGSASNSKQDAAIKRKIASDKLAGEITSASGKSNWEKVHQVYKIKDSTLLTGN